jgi:hypothetical protein
LTGIAPFNNLTPNELEELYMIPVWVCILIAGADNVFSKNEIKRAVKLTRKKQQTGDGFLMDYYKIVSKRFEVNVKGYIALMPKDLEQRNEYLDRKLTRANDLFKKIEIRYAQQLYLSFRDFAYQVAHASGGLFGLLSISFAESRFIDLKMIKDPSKVET